MPRVVDAELRRAELTDAAARVIARSGVDAATLRRIADEAGWTTGVLTHYFADKESLLLATFQASLASRRSRRLDRRLGPHFGPADELRASLVGALPIDEDRRRHWLVTLACCTQASGNQALADAQRDAYREYRHHLTELVRELGVPAADPPVDPRDLAERLIAAADGVAIQALFDPASWPAERQLAALEAAMAALSMPT